MAVKGWRSSLLKRSKFGMGMRVSLRLISASASFCWVGLADKKAPSNPPNDYGQYKGSAANHHYIFQNVVETLNGKNVATTNVLEGLKVVEIIEKIYNLRDHKK